MQTLYRLSRYILPIVFFGYAPFANLAYFEEPGSKLAPLDLGVLKGTLTASFDHAYKTAMPHREASIGLIGAARYVLAGEGRKGVIAGTNGWLFTAEETRAPIHDLGPTLGQIAKLQRQLASRGSKLIMIPLPAKMDIAADQSETLEFSRYLARLNADFLSGLKHSGIDVVDTRANLSAMGDEAFFATDTHWTVAGAKTVAKTVADSGLVELGQTEMNLKTLPTKTMTGDLVAYVTTDQLAPWIGLAAERVTPYLVNAAQPADLGDIFAEAAVDIVLVGTSYSANPDWSFTEALKLSLKTDVLNAAAQGKGPVKPMLDYLASDGFRDTPPKVVLWEFPVRYLTDPELWANTAGPMEMASAN